MTAGYALVIKRLYGPSIVRIAAKHNLREIACEIGVDGHIDPARICDNFILRGPPSADGVAQLGKALTDAAGVTKFRKTAVMALELLFTLKATSTIDVRLYFEEATRWAERHFGVPVLSCVVHLDEGAPHAHALLLPLVGGRMGGSDLHGGKAKLWAMQASFHDEVGARHGLARQSPQKRLGAGVRAAAISSARAILQANSALTDAVIDALLLPHAKAPDGLLSALGLSMPAPKLKGKSFVAIMTAPCESEPRNPIGKGNRVQLNPIGMQETAFWAKSYPYTCVGIEFSNAPNPSVEHQPIAAATSAQRHSDVAQRAIEPASLSSLDQREHAAPRSTSASKLVERQTSSADTGDAAIDQTTEQRNNATAPLSTGAPALRDPATARYDARATDRRPATRHTAAEHHGPDNATAERAPLAGSASAGDYQRQRDDDEHTAFWNPERGEFAKPLIKASGRELAETAVQHALQRRASRQTGERTRVGDAKSHNELLESHYGKRMDPRAKSKASSID